MDTESTARFTSCSFKYCGNPGVRGASCTSCRKHLCWIHVQAQYHSCAHINELSDEEWQRSIQDEVDALLGQVSVSSIQAKASSLKDGQPCTFIPGKIFGDGAIMGCANYHGWIEFQDGVRWLVRIPRKGFTDLPDSLVEYFVLSEFATLRFLESTSVPAPRAFGYGLESDPSNKVGVSYLLIEALPGKPYQNIEATEEQQGKVVQGIARILDEIYRHPVSRAGSLCLQNGKPVVGPVASNRFLHLDRHGPFASSQAYYEDIVNQYLDLIADGQLYTAYPEEAFLFYVIVSDNLDLLMKGDHKGSFYLKHVDDKGDHILVDDDYNITGIIDWQFARCVPSQEAFGPSLVTADLEDLYAGRSTVGELDSKLAHELQSLGNDELFRIASGGEVARKVSFGLASGLFADEARMMVVGLLRSLGRSQNEDEDMRMIGKYRMLAMEDSRWARVEAISLANKKL